MPPIVPPLLVLVALIHLLPVVGVGGRARLESLYGTAIDEPNLLLLMRHRAVLFGLLGAFLLAAAFDRRLHLAGLVAGLVSVGSFLLLAGRNGDLNSHVRRVYLVDAVAAACLLAGLLVHLTGHGVGLSAAEAGDLNPGERTADPGQHTRILAGRHDLGARLRAGDLGEIEATEGRRGAAATRGGSR